MATTILDYDTDPDNDQDDDISDGEHSDDGEELEDEHSLSSFLSVGEGELEDSMSKWTTFRTRATISHTLMIIPVRVSTKTTVAKIPPTMMNRTRTKE